MAKTKAKKNASKLSSAFKELGLKKSIEACLTEIQTLYQEDAIPWVIGYSGGKDSTAVLQLVWQAIEKLPSEKYHKPIHVISTDTLVENPIVASWVNKSLKTMKSSAEKKKIPITPHRLTPTIQDTFWVNLIGHGYPAPRHKFRWCTDRLKINPSNSFIMNVVKDNGEAILVLGTRKAESSKRHHSMSEKEKLRIRDKLSPNVRLPNALVYTPIENWSNDDVWVYLMQFKNPWGYNNKDLLTMYQGASPDGECPLVVDTTTPSCGDSRFGCWVCTMVDKDKSMTAMIQNDDEKEWMLPLLELRNELDFRANGLEKADRHLRDFRRKRGFVQIYNDRAVHGPYLQSVRENWVKKLLNAQNWIRKNGPSHVKDIELITIEELSEIRRIWVVEKHEFEDSMPAIYKEVMGCEFPGKRVDDTLPFGYEEMAVLKDICGKDHLRFELVRELLDIQRRYQSRAKRMGLYGDIDKAFRRSFYKDEADATDRAKRQIKKKEGLKTQLDDMQLNLLKKLDEK